MVTEEAMVESSLDVLLCKEVWGGDYKNHPEYLEYVTAIGRGRSVFSVHEDLRERLAHQKSHSERKTGSSDGRRNGW
jgi:hypothetical protein